MKPSGRNKRLLQLSALALGILVWVSTHPHPATTLAQPPPGPDGVFRNPAAANLYADITRIENQLYGHPYMEESMGKRLNRLERSLFGAPQGGTLENRFLSILDKMKEEQVVRNASVQERTVDYLEQRFFQDSYADQPLEQRLHKLETYIFGRSFERHTPEERMKKLSYTVPITAKEIRLSKEGQLIATTKPRPKKVADTRNQSYFDAVFKLPNAKVLRWMNLPARVYIEQANPDQAALVQEAVRLWNGVYPLALTTNPNEADIFINWAQPAQQPRYLTTPSVQLDDKSRLRTVMTISMAPFLQRPQDLQLRAMLHQLGHASGIWGHSNDPQDVMYPSNRHEASDFPEKWHQVPVRLSTDIPEPAQHAPPSTLSERDKKTLLQIYSSPGQDIRSYAP